MDEKDVEDDKIGYKNFGRRERRRREMSNGERLKFDGGLESYEGMSSWKTVPSNRKVQDSDRPRIV